MWSPLRLLLCKQLQTLTAKSIAIVCSAAVPAGCSKKMSTNAHLLGYNLGDIFAIVGICQVLACIPGHFATFAALSVHVVVCMHDPVGFEELLHNSIGWMFFLLLMCSGTAPM